MLALKRGRSQNNNLIKMFKKYVIKLPDWVKIFESQFSLLLLESIWDSQEEGLIQDKEETGVFLDKLSVKRNII